MIAFGRTRSASGMEPFRDRLLLRWAKGGGP
jgi:hypothetical protein